MLANKDGGVKDAHRSQGPTLEGVVDTISTVYRVNNYENGYIAPWLDLSQPVFCSIPGSASHETPTSCTEQ
jgi:hypothetical protein